MFLLYYDVKFIIAIYIGLDDIRASSRLLKQDVEELCKNAKNEFLEKNLYKTNPLTESFDIIIRKILEKWLIASDSP